MSFLLAPSLLSADFLHLEQEIQMINESKADWLHLDVMDGVYVPNITIGFPILSHVSKILTKPMDVHLMIVEPQKFINQLRDIGTYMMAVHYEVCTHLHSVVTQIKAAGMKAGVVLNPHTPIELLEDILPEVDMVLIMSVNPGFGGQAFIPNSINKVRRLRQMISNKGLNTLIEVDGGIDIEIGKKLVQAGADVLVAGNTVFKAENPKEMIARMKREI